MTTLTLHTWLHAHPWHFALATAALTTMIAGLFRMLLVWSTRAEAARDREFLAFLRDQHPDIYEKAAQEAERTMNDLERARLDSAAYHALRRQQQREAR